MGLLSKLRAIDDQVLQPTEVQIKEAARLWWAFLLMSPAAFAVTALVYFSDSSDVRFLFLLPPALMSGGMTFFAGFQFNNHLRATEPSKRGFWGQRIVQ